jgi:hypothetical protein
MSEGFLHDMSALIHLSAFEAKERPKSRELKSPGMEALAALAERAFDALVATGDEAVE